MENVTRNLDYFPCSLKDCLML
ncbi:hypothetical protein AB3S75_015990 [Citrus x aurantiifolia]